MGVTSNIEICNLALSMLGNYGTIENIDTPVKTKEKTYAQWYSTAVEYALKLAMPNFALARRIVSQVATNPAPFGYTYAYEKPADCLKVLGFGDIDEKDLRYTIEGDYIYTDEDYADGLELRFIRNITDVSRFTPEFVLFAAEVLAAFTCTAVTQDAARAQALKDRLPMRAVELSGINAQENPPIRKSTSKFKQAKYGYVTRNNEKR